MVYQLDNLLKLLRTLALLAPLTVVAASCASGASEDDLPGTAELAQIDCGREGCPARPCQTSSCQLGRCIYAPAENGAKCDGGLRDPGICVSGECCTGCVDTTGKAPLCLDCNDRNPCTEDVCDGRGGGCLNSPVKDLTPCPNGMCFAGKCCTGCIDETGTCQTSGSGDPEYCGLGGVQCDICKDDSNACSDDVCVQGKCTYPAKPDGVSCESDQNVCNGTSRCSGGSCKGGQALSCPNSNPCVTVTCDPVKGCVAANNTAACEDGNPCTVNDRCSRGSCVGGEPATCDDNETCTVDGCSKERGGCFHEPLPANTACDDRNDCTTSSACGDGPNAGRCIGEGGRTCADADPCTIDGCNVQTQQCDYSRLEEEGTPCIPPANKCLLNGMCNANGVCTGGVMKDCSDGNPCTADDCDPATGECVRTDLDEGECSDDSACTTNDRCEGGTCVGDAIECAALDDCHLPGECDETTGICDDPRRPNGEPCDSDTGTCSNGACTPNPVTGAGGAANDGGAPSGEGGAPGADAGESAGGTADSAGAAGAAGASGEGAQPSSGATGGSRPNGDGEGGDPARGRPFVRDPGGCGCAVPGSEGSGAPPLALLAGLLGLVIARRRAERPRVAARD